MCQHSGVWGGVRKVKRAASQAAMRQQPTNTGWMAFFLFLSEMHQQSINTGWLAAHCFFLLQARVASYLLPSMLASILLNIPKFLEARLQVFYDDYHNTEAWLQVFYDDHDIIEARLQVFL